VTPDQEQEKQINYTQFRLDELKVRRDKIDEEIAYEQRVLDKLLGGVVE